MNMFTAHESSNFYDSGSIITTITHEKLIFTVQITVSGIVYALAVLHGSNKPSVSDITNPAPANFGSNTDQIPENTPSTITISNLAPNTKYDVYLYAESINPPLQTKINCCDKFTIKTKETEQGDNPQINIIKNATHVSVRKTSVLSLMSVFKIVYYLPLQLS